MPNWSGLGDVTTNNLPNLGGKGRQIFRASNAINNYLPGTVLQIVAIDSQVLPDFQTVQPTPAASLQTKIAGVVAGDWGGFDGFAVTPASYVSVASTLNARGTSGIQAVVKGVTYVNVDTSAGVTIVDGIPLVNSANSIGYAQGAAVATVPMATLVGIANLPSTGIGSSLTGAALLQAAQIATVAGTPTVTGGDVLTLTIQAPYTDNQPGTVQKMNIVTTLTAAQSATVTTAAAAVAANANANPLFATYFIATSALGVVTVTVNAQSMPFLVTAGGATVSGINVEAWRFYTHVSGMVANSLTFAASVSPGAGATFVAGGGTFAGGTGYKGRVPALVYGMY